MLEIRETWSTGTFGLLAIVALWLGREHLSAKWSERAPQESVGKLHWFLNSHFALLLPRGGALEFTIFKQDPEMDPGEAASGEEPFHR